MSKASNVVRMDDAVTTHPKSHSQRDLFDEHRAAQRLGVSTWTLRSWRCRGIGPIYVKLGRGSQAPVRYNPDDLDEFVRQGRLVPSARAVLED